MVAALRRTTWKGETMEDNNRTQTQIHWYPGHMAKARRMLQENLKLIDVVVELVDARAPAATRNPDFDALFQNRTRVVLLNKSDLADPSVTKEWVARFAGQGVLAEAIAAAGNAAKKQAVRLIEQAAAPRVEKMRARGVNKVVRVMVAGIPNVGKSTFINRIAGQQRAQVGDRPGVTRGKQWVRITPYLELMDTPGLLWPKLEVPRFARHLAYIGSIRDEVTEADALAASLLDELLRLCPAEVAARYTGLVPGMTPEQLLAAVCRCRSFYLPGQAPDLERAARTVLDEYRAGKIARVSLERPGEGADDENV